MIVRCSRVSFFATLGTDLLANPTDLLVVDMDLSQFVQIKLGLFVGSVVGASIDDLLLDPRTVLRPVSPQTFRLREKKPGDNAGSTRAVLAIRPRRPVSA